MGVPPLESGAFHAMEACPDPGVATTEVGAPGIVEGTTGNEGEE